ncbi:ATP-binding protein [Dehalococcoides mccartyi]|uniref:ATP-binding protein n=1 Tax=Dehalococcoides mccartyi TaxID=61435 RepID=UPI0006623B77|nr:ATP-binding protein [Dehalococcoides mccartyi]
MEHIKDILGKQINIKGSSSTTSSKGKVDKAAEANTCPLCKGAKFVYPVSAEGVTDFSRVIPCQCTQSESGADREKRLLTYSCLGGLQKYTFEKLNSLGKTDDPHSQNTFKQAYEAAMDYAFNPSGWLVFSGPSGTGKTHLAAAIANKRLSMGQPVLYKRASELIDDLKKSFEPDSESGYSQSFDILKNAPLLIIDDLTVQSGSDWSKEKLDQLLTYRFSQELPTIITLSTTITELDPRIQSRLLDKSLSRVYPVAAHPEDNLEYRWDNALALQKKMTFENYDHKRANLTAEQRQNIDAAYNLALEFSRNPESWLVFQGETGCGKTHLASAIVNERYRQGKPAMFVVVPEFLDHLRSTFSPESKTSYDQMFDAVKNAKLLVLDDFGEQSSTPWAQEKLYQVINYRYNRRLATVITTRCQLSEIEIAISSRFVDPQISMVFNITAPNFRCDSTGQQKQRPVSRMNRTTRPQR